MLLQMQKQVGEPLSSCRTSLFFAEVSFQRATRHAKRACSLLNMIDIAAWRQENYHHALYTRYHMSCFNTTHDRDGLSCQLHLPRAAHCIRHRQSRNLDCAAAMILGCAWSRTTHTVSRDYLRLLTQLHRNSNPNSPLQFAFVVSRRAESTHRLS
jgi:hypothetical protein